MARRSIKATIAAIRDAGMAASYDPDAEEFTVNFPGGKSPTAYFTSDSDDAIATAKVMRASRPATF